MIEESECVDLASGKGGDRRPVADERGPPAAALDVPAFVPGCYQKQRSERRPAAAAAGPPQSGHIPSGATYGPRRVSSSLTRVAPSV